MLHVDKHVVTLILCLRKASNISFPEELVHIIGVKAILVRMTEIQDLQCSVLAGVSTFARKRRAKRLGVCHRCFRDKPGYYFTKRCNGYDCVPSQLGEKAA
ncbi:hypothetical protein HHB67_11245, partial [Neisseria meningitidis]|nr:hypothetical protein [Neisseria meningitidis]